MNIKCEYTFLPDDEFKKHCDESRDTLKRIGGMANLHLIVDPYKELHMAVCRDCREHLDSLDANRRNQL